MVNSVGCWELTSSHRSVRVSGLGTKGKVLASNGQIVCLFLWAPTKPYKGNFQLVSSHCTENVLRKTTPWPPKHSKAGKRRALAADQQDIFTVEESIRYCEQASVSSRMFGNHSGTFLAQRPSGIPLHLIFSLMWRSELGPQRGR